MALVRMPHVVSVLFLYVLISTPFMMTGTQAQSLSFPLRGQSGWDGANDLMYLHEMKVLGYDASFQQIKFAIPCVGGLDNEQGMQWWKVDWLVFKVHSPPCKTEDCFDLIINNVPFIPTTGRDYGLERIKVNASTYCPDDMRSPFQCGDTTQTTFEVWMLTSAILDEPPAEDIGVDIRASQFNVHFRGPTPNMYPAMPFCKGFRVIWDAPIRKYGLVKGSKRALLSVVLEAGVQVVSTWQIRKGMYPVDDYIGRSMEQLNQFLVAGSSRVAAWIRQLVCFY